MMAHGIKFGVDVGGTFTDVICHRPGQPQSIRKVPSTRPDQSVAILQGLNALIEDLNLSRADIERVVHGTTVATNAVLERKGAKLGLIGSWGFRDVLEIGRQIRKSMYDMVLQPEPPVFLAVRHMRREVRERLAADGSVLIPLDEESVLTAADELVALGAESIAVTFLYSYIDPSHEIRARDLIRARHPRVAVSISSEVDPAFREYERTAVTAFDAYIKPIVDSYLGKLETGLVQVGLDATLQIMQSRGGLASSMVARQRPVRLFLSGPAAGVIGGRMVGNMAAQDNIITVDIGGTSSDIALISRGKAPIRAESSIGGYPVRVPMVDVNTIGAGGGSIAWIDAAGSLKVGPHSAGSDPGPACYGRGGREPTVTDASVVLGYLDPDYFAGGTVALQPELAFESIERVIAKPLGMSVEDAALGIHRVVNAQMFEGVRLVSVRQGLDPRQFALIPLGGAGPLHATALADDLGISKIVVPRHPGVLSAAGLLAAPVEHEMSCAFLKTLEKVDLGEMKAAFEALDKSCGDLIRSENLAPSEVSVSYHVDMCYVGQSYYLEVPIHLELPDPLSRLYDDFVASHERVYGYATRHPARIVNLRTIHIGSTPRLDSDAFAVEAGAFAKEARDVRIPGVEGLIPARVLDRIRMPAGTRFAGPAIIEQMDTTLLVTPHWSGEVAADGNIILQTDRVQSG
jgi:N-methylhydantoinase A